MNFQKLAFSTFLSNYSVLFILKWANPYQHNLDPKLKNVCSFLIKIQTKPFFVAIICTRSDLKPKTVTKLVIQVILLCIINNSRRY